MLQIDKGLISALRTLAQAMNEMPSGCGHNTADRLIELYNWRKPITI